MKTVKQLKMELRNAIEDIKVANRFSNMQIADASGVTNVTVGKAINAPYTISAEAVQKVYDGCVKLEKERFETISKRMEVAQ